MNVPTENAPAPLGPEVHRLLFESLPEPAWVYDAESLAFLDVNAAAIAGYGFAREEFLAMTLRDIRVPEDVAALEASGRTDLPGPRPSGVIRHRKKDGTVLDAEVTSHDLTYRNRPARLVVARDITEDRRLQVELQHSQKMEGIGRLAGGIAHDFNNLLTAILGQAEMARLILGEGDRPEAELDQIIESAKRAASLTRQLLAFARKEVAHPEVVSLNELILQTDKLLRRLIGEHIALVTIPVPGLGRVSVDRDQISQVLINLAVNARDAMPNGGRLTIETANVTLDEAYARQRADVVAGPHVALSVTDTGTGMTPDVMAHVFEPFFTTKAAGKGTGLGLATCYGIVRQHGGHIAVYSEIGVGTTFRIYLPRVEEPAGRAVEAREEADALASGSETILLAEDEPRVRKLVAGTLRRAGYTVVEAGSGTEALARVREHAAPLHLLVTDLVMPQMGGTELAAEIRRQQPGLPVLLISGYSEDAAVRSGLSERGTAFLPKPFSAHQLARRVRELLDERTR